MWQQQQQSSGDSFWQTFQSQCMISEQRDRYINDDMPPLHVHGEAAHLAVSQPPMPSAALAIASATNAPLAQTSATTSIPQPTSTNGAEGEDIKVRIVELSYENRSLKQQLQTAHKKIERLHQEMKRYNLVFYGVQVEYDDDRHLRDESCYFVQAIIRLCDKALHVPLVAGDISSAYRLPSVNNYHQPIVASFARMVIRDDVYRRRSLLNVYNREKREDERIYIHEDLSPGNQKIMKVARAAMKRGELRGTWTKACNVVVQCNQGCVHVVENMDQLRAILSSRNE